jgi:hypothetical protein
VAASSTGGAQKQGPGSDPPVSLDPGRGSGGPDPELLQMDDDDATVCSTTRCYFSRWTTTT